MLPQRITKPIQIGLTSIFLFALTLSGLLQLVVTQPVAHAAGKPNTIPALMEWTDGAGSYTFSAASRIMYNGAGLAADAATFSEDLLSMTGLAIATVSGSSPATGDIYLTLGDPDTTIGTEGYKLTIGSSVTISARANAGAFYGTRTLLQLLKQNFTIAAGSARDWPMYPFRGTHVDNGRKYFTPAYLRDMIRQQAYLKINIYHLHLSDRQGWRLELFNHPEVPTAPYLTQAELADLIALANKYHITIVPEFDSPGHLTAALRNHPELWMNGTNTGQLDLSLDASYTFMEEIYAEVIPLFPGPYWHLGLDEYQLPSSDPEYIAYAQSHFCDAGETAVVADALIGWANHFNALVQSYGKTGIGWDDILDVTSSCLNPDTTITTDHWNTGPQAKALPRGHMIINSKFSSTYYVLGGSKPTLSGILSWDPTKFFQGTSIAVQHPQLRGGKGLHIWCDNPTAETEVQIAASTYDLYRAVGQKTWNSPMLVTSFDTLITLIGAAPGYGEHLGGAPTPTPPPPPTNTPTRTNTPTGATNTPTRTNTPVPPTNTPTRTNTPTGPTNTPTWTNTPVPPTNTPTRTNTPTGPTNTPTRTNTPVPPTNTPTRTNTPTGPTATPGAGGIAFVKNVGTVSCGTTSNTITVPAGGVAAGNTLIARVSIRAGSPGGTLTVSDSKGNTYTIDKDALGSGIRMVILSANIATALVPGDTITVNYPPVSPNSTGFVVSEFSGISATNRVDASGSATGTSAAPSASLTTITANTLVYGAIATTNNPLYTEASGWTTNAHLSASCGGSPGNSTNHAAYRIVSTTGSYTYNPTLSTGMPWAAVVVAYK